MVLCGIFAALIGIGAFIQIPIPIIPLTMQDLFVMLAGILLGAKFGALSVFIYMFIGLLGFPVFTRIKFRNRDSKGSFSPVLRGSG